MTIIMKRLITLALLAMAILMPVSAQTYYESRYYNHGTGRLDYGNSSSGWFDTGEMYYGLRIGPSFSKVNSDDEDLDGGSWQTGLNIAVIMGIPLTTDMPLYIETGLAYTEKGGKKKVTSLDGVKKKMTYDLNYLEIPIVLKYIYDVDDEFTLQPYFGGYLACGVSGKIKNYEERKAFSSFSDDAFQRFDGGLRFGLGAGYNVFYADLAFDLGLSNICHDMFDTSHNRSITLNFGVNF